MMAENQPAPLTPAPPGMVSLGVNADGEEVMTDDSGISRTKWFREKYYNSFF